VCDPHRQLELVIHLAYSVVYITVPVCICIEPISSFHSTMNVETHDALDLHDIAVLLNYERASTEPRFRHAKLREVASSTSPFRTIAFPPSFNLWDNAPAHRVGYVFDKKIPDTPDERDLPGNMLPEPVPDNLAMLSKRELETIYWQARGHDGCYKSVTLLQHFFDLYPPSQPLRIRTAEGKNFVTDASTLSILEYTLEHPKSCMFAIVIPGQTYITGENDTLQHAVVGFSYPGEEQISTVLDLSSMQFGDVGRGDGGRNTFILESVDKLYARFRRIASECDPSYPKVSTRIGPSPDDRWLMDVAARTKKRWDNRRQEPWCGYCGAPGSGLKRCTKCWEVHYCDAEHQTAAWPFHKKFCSEKKA
jgi:hypothetical protein